MSIALKSESGSFIYFDVVTAYSQTFPSSISQHPVDGSGTVSDHITKQNPIIKLRGFITGADFNFSKPTLSSEDRQFIGLDQVVVESDIATEVKVKSEESFTGLLPDSIGQFFTDTLPEIENIAEGRDASYSEKVLFSILLGFYDNKSKVSLFEFDRGLIVEEIFDLFITKLSLIEKSESGDALEFDITLERITISFLLEAEVEEVPAASIQLKTDAKVEKGDKSGSESEDIVTDIERSSAAKRGLDLILGRG